MGQAAPIIMASAAVLSAGFSLYEGIAGGNAQREAAKKQQEAANAQAAIADMSAIDALTRGAAEVGKIRQGASQTIASQRVAYAGAGVDVGSGTAVDVLGSTRALSELDVLTAKNNAARAAWGFKQEAHNLRQHGAYARQAGEAQATGTLLTGAAGAAKGLGSAIGTLNDAGYFDLKHTKPVMPTMKGKK